ncbi:MAG: hypothetical protein QMD06_01275 [Candidatus Altarchaeum sp.]|nr:hypothetical protein [Candidatus Altarchaeum sp.]
MLKEYSITLKCLECGQERTINKEKRIREIKIGINTSDRVLLFQTPDHLMYEVNKIISNKKIVFFEVNTESDSFGFLLTKIENTDKILSSDKIKA